MKYDELLNHKSYLDCENPRDEEQHGRDKVSMFSKAENFGKYGAIVKIQPVDKAHKKDKATYQVVHPEDYMSVAEGCDIKNGADMVIHDGLFAIAAYGQNYTMGLKKESYMVETLCSFKFLDGNADFEKLDEMSRKELEKEFEEGSHFMDSKDLIWKVRDVKRKDLDTLIQEAEERRQGDNDGGKGRGKEKGKDRDKE